MTPITTLKTSTKRTLLKDRLLFLRHFLRKGLVVASVTPSSRWMSRAMVKDIPYGSASVIVELGAGTGPVTAELLKRIHSGCQLLIVEQDSEFCALLRKRFPTAEVIEHDACALDHILRQREIRHVDHIVCGLATPSLPHIAQKKLMHWVAEFLHPEGTFRQLTEIPLFYQTFYKRHFEEVSFRFVLRNIPPGGYYLCRRPVDTVLTTSGDTVQRQYRSPLG